MNRKNEEKKGGGISMLEQASYAPWYLALFTVFAGSLEFLFTQRLTLMQASGLLVVGSLLTVSTARLMGE